MRNTFCLRRPGEVLFINILKKLSKKTSIWDDTPKERHLTDREWVGGATPLFEKTAPCSVWTPLQKLFISEVM